jgi:hypothetical protein
MPPVPPPARNRGGRPFPTFTNAAQLGSAACPDGLSFSFLVPAGQFAGRNQAIADAEALSYANRQAQLMLICLSAITTPALSCAGTPYSASITATGRRLAVSPQADTWTLTSGTLPDGLTFNGGQITGGTATITGTPTAPGSSTFRIRVTDPAGDFMEKQYTLTVGGISNANSLSQGQVGTAYSAQLQAVGFFSPVFTLAGGSLPSGLSLSASGLITGTPTTQQTSAFSVLVSEADGSASCASACSITIKPGTFPPWNVNWSNPAQDTFSGATASASFNPKGFTMDVTSAPVAGSQADISNDNGGTPQSYAGGGVVSCNLHLSLSGTFTALSFTSCTVQVLQNGVNILGPITVGNTTGEFDFPFTVNNIAGSSLIVGMSGSCNSGPSNEANHFHVVATLTP